jgi:hypothetical protein
MRNIVTRDLARAPKYARMPRVHVVAGVLLSLLASVVPAAAEYLPYCRIDLSFSNRNRHVYGEVNAECTYGCPWPDFVHSHKWGNWGVDSNWSPRWDGEQYRGWQTTDTYCGGSMNPPQWNSCYASSIPGSSSDFNFAGNEEQFSGDARDYSHVSFYYQVDEVAGCTQLNGYTTTLNNNNMRIFELDWDHSEFVAQLDFPSLMVTFSCPSPSSCSTTYSGWVGSYGNSVTSAEIEVRAQGVLIWEDFSTPPIVP